MVREVLLVQFRIVTVRCGPCQITSFSKVELVTKLIEYFCSNVTPYASGHSACTSIEFKVRWSTAGDCNADINECTSSNCMTNLNDVCSCREWLEYVWSYCIHGSVCWRVNDGFTRNCVSVLVDHFSSDSKRFISRNCRS